MEQDHPERRVKRKAKALFEQLTLNPKLDSYKYFHEHYKLVWKSSSDKNAACERFMSGEQVIRDELPKCDQPAIDYFFSNYKLEPDEMKIEFDEDGTFHIDDSKEFYFITSHIKGIQTTGGTNAYATKVSEGLYVKKVYVQSRKAVSTCFMNKYEFYFHDSDLRNVVKLPCSIYTSRSIKSKKPLLNCTVTSVKLVHSETYGSPSPSKKLRSTSVQTDISISPNSKCSVVLC